MNGQLIHTGKGLECLVLVAESDNVAGSMRVVCCQNSRELFLKLSLRKLQLVTWFDQLLWLK
jgi:hypothetical protein